uniref:Uncharacterized protein n=1 Tax=Rhizophora mucronata TaxID=61149 RepID=A0A2P2NCJ2_RHIMU
MSPPATVDPVI